MARTQFGLALPGGSRDKSLRGQYMSNIRKGLDLAKGHYDSAWFVDHLMFEDNDQIDGWTGITYLSALYPELHFGNAVLCQSFRNPALLAKMGATLQFMSGGRFILGLGAGWHEPEYTAYGYDFPSATVRVEQLEEYVQIVKAMWTEPKATFHGEYYRVQDAYCEPKPDPVPTIMIGGSKPKMLRLIARHADWWNVSWTGIKDYREQVEEMERACDEVGRDPATLRRTWFGGSACAPTEKEVQELTGGRMSSDNAFVGTPEQIVEQLQPFIELGVDYFLLGFGGFPKTTTPELIINEVMSAVNKLAASSK